MNATSLTKSPENKPSTFWSMQIPRWSKWYMVLVILTGIVVCVTTSLIRTRDEGIMFLLISGVVTYFVALAACVKAFIKDKSNVAPKS